MVELLEYRENGRNLGAVYFQIERILLKPEREGPGNNGSYCPMVHYDENAVEAYADIRGRRAKMSRILVPNSLLDYLDFVPLGFDRDNGSDPEIIIPEEEQELMDTINRLLFRGSVSEAGVADSLSR